MLVITPDQMKAMDHYAIHEIGIPSIVLMENAALKVVEQINLKKINSYTIVCATGNNGGDGLAIARHLILKDKKVDLFIVGNLDQMTNDFQINLKILKNMNISFTHLSDMATLNKLKASIKSTDLTIDAIFGIGLHRKIEGLFYEVIQLMNTYSKSILAVDTPSGLDGNSGDVLGISIQADQTVTFHHMKKGLINNKKYTGEVIVADIGIPKSVTEHILKNE